MQLIRAGNAAIVLVASEEFIRKNGLEAKAVEILGMAMTTDFPSSYEGSMIKMVGADMTRSAAQKVYEQSGFGPENIDVVELHDCFSCNELITYEGLGLSAHDIVQLSAVGVTPEYVQQIQKLGYKDISAHDITQLYAVGVKPSYVKEIKKLGCTNISIHDITQLHAVGVKLGYIKQIKKLGYEDISAHDITQLHAVGVKPDYVRQIKSLGYDGISIHDITQFYVTGVTPDYPG